MKRLGLLSVSLCVLMGCAQILEHSMATHKGHSRLGIELGQISSDWCHLDACVRVTDWSQLHYEDADKPVTKMTVNVSLNLNQQEFEERLSFSFDELGEGAPVVLMFPGYGMRSEALGLKALYFRSRGMKPIVMASPTEQRPFSFGLAQLDILASQVEQRFSGRPVYAYGFSLGSLAVTEFTQRYPVEGAIVVAPLLDFEQAATYLMASHRRDSMYGRAIPMRSYQKGLARMTARSGVAEHKLYWPYAVANLPDNTLVVASYYDSISGFPQLAKEVEQQQRAFYMADIDDSSFDHPGLGLPLEPVTSSIDGWLQQQEN